MSYTPYHLVIFGPQGSGKGTQAKLLEKEFGLVYLGMGDILREIASEKSKFGQQVRTTLAGGHLVPDAMADEIMARKIGDIPPSVGFVVDGYPRTVPQVDGFRKTLTGLSRMTPRPIFLILEVPKRELLKRLHIRRGIEQREDETDEAIATRLDIYEKQTRPLLEHLEDWTEVIKINGNQPVPDVTKEIIKKVKDADGQA